MSASSGSPLTLACLGGAPAYASPLHVGRPNIGDQAAFLRRTQTILDERYFTNNGPMVREFEQRIADYVGVGHCVAMCNATVALEIAIRALGLRGEVIVPAYTFVATAHALQWQEITPVFADMDPATHLIDPAAIERLITPRTTGIIGVHVWGRPCDTDALAALGKRHGLTVLYDAAHAFGCSRGDRMVGTFGACEVFSFHATKFLNSFEGGAVVTDDADLAAKLRLMRNFGFSGYDRVSYIGTNGKMTEICAAMGLTSLDAIDGIVAVNRRNHAQYSAELGRLPGLSVLPYPEANRCNFQYVVAEVDPAACPLTRDEIVAVLHAENVLARKYFWPGAHRMEPYRSYFPNAAMLLPATERTAARVIVLPNGQSISEAHVGTVCGLVRRALELAPLVRSRLAAS